MATDHNFRIKNGLTVGAVEVIDSSGKLTANAFGTNSNEKIEDVVADMITGSTHSNITVTYNDTNGTLAFSAAAQYGDSDVESYLDGGVKAGLSELVNQRLTPLQEKIEKMMHSADELLVNLNDVFDDKTKANLKNSIAGLSTTISSFKETSNSLNQTIKNNQKKI
mgnify:CR=1 FL=1